MTESAGLGSSPVFSVVTSDWSWVLFFFFFLLFKSGIYVNIGVHQLTHITLLRSLPPPVTLPSILPFNLINMG